MSIQVNKCAYRIHLEELLARELVTPELLSQCEDCDGYNHNLGIYGPCPDYIDQQHLLNFYSMSLPKK